MYGHAVGRRLLPLAVVGALALLPGGSSSAQVDECSARGGVPYPVSSGATVDVHQPVYATHVASLELRGAGEVVPGSLRYLVVAPGGGTASPRSDRYFGARYTPPKVGRYSVTATWRELTCGNGGGSTYADITTPPSQFEALPGERPKPYFHTTRRPTRPNATGDAALTGFLNCPAPSRAAHDAADLIVYYARGGKRPTHASRRLRLHQAGGCDGLKRVGKRERVTKAYAIVLVRSQLTVVVRAPARLRVLMEIRYAGSLLRRSYGTFGPSRTGESVRRR